MSPVGRLARITRGFTTSALRRSGAHEDPGGYPGANIPFSITNRYKLALLFVAFFGSGFGAPFLVLRHQLLKS